MHLQGTPQHEALLLTAYTSKAHYSIATEPKNNV